MLACLPQMDRLFHREATSGILEQMRISPRPDAAFDAGENRRGVGGGGGAVGGGGTAFGGDARLGGGANGRKHGAICAGGVGVRVSRGDGGGIDVGGAGSRDF